MWCPVDFRRVHSEKRRKDKIDAQIYDPEMVNKVNRERQIIKTGHHFDGLV